MALEGGGRGVCVGGGKGAGGRRRGGGRLRLSASAPS